MGDMTKDQQLLVANLAAELIARITRDDHMGATYSLQALMDCMGFEELSALESGLVASRRGLDHIKRLQTPQTREEK
jgi:hypothetical protein